MRDVRISRAARRLHRQKMRALKNSKACAEKKRGLVFEPGRGEWIASHSESPSPIKKEERKKEASCN